MPRVRTAHFFGALVWLLAATATVAAQEGGCAGGSVEQISRQLAQAKAQARNVGCTGLLALFRPRGLCAGVTAQVQALEAQLRRARQQAFPSVSTSIVQGPFQERVAVPDCGRPAARARVVCVRLCDGYYFPVNHSITQKNLAKDEQKCLGQYPEGQAALYIDRSGGENIATMVSLNGKLKYGDQPFAFAFQRSFDPSCPRPGAHLAEAARAAAKTVPDSAAIVREAIAVESVSAAPETVRLVGPPYAYYFPEREGVDALTSDAASLLYRAGPTAVHVEIEKASVPGASSVFSDERALADH